MKQTNRIYILLCLGLFLCTQLTAGPKLEVDKKTHDFGTLYPHIKVKHEYILKNTGDSILTITSVKPQCGCTTSALSLKDIKPNQSTPLEIFFEAPNAMGPITKQVEIKSNDPKNPVTIIKLSATIKKEYFIYPKTGISFGEIYMGDKAKLSFEVRSAENKPVNIDRIEYKKLHYKIKHYPLDLKTNNNIHSEKFEVELDTKNTYRPIRKRDLIKIFPDKNSERYIEAYIIGKVKGDIEISQEAFYVAGIKHNDESTQTITLKQRHNKPFAIKGFKTREKMLQLNLEKKSPSEYQLKVYLAPKQLKKSINGIIQIETDDKVQKRINIQFTYQFKRG